ncbi:DNA repair photolyase [Herbihabitans rhizosphaerae]|uniref:DNA repair photolyase n=1 Tax=Herbihabitans rhizosphaerae TaxID=1872711 RepID=A0A4Q7KHF8_9PSEU|nr:Rv2578c family radical SAM protein [Herbihabitans rhizosphaerae]RZS34331.1 DNA repair photolyase [Herbihabitans rhizosphaerae]
MRWESQLADRELPLPGLVRTVTTPEFAGVVFHEVRAKSVLNKVPEASSMPFKWTVNPYRGCAHGCVYCFARNTHTYLDLDSGHDFDSQIVVKVNTPDVLAAQLRSSRWRREHVAMGTNTDPYQRAEGRYRLMPGVIKALADSGTPFSILTKGTVLSRDLPLLEAAGRSVPVGMAVSIALLDRELQRSVEPGVASPQARLELVRKIREAGLPCGVLVAPVMPGLTDSTEALDDLLAAIADAGATGVTVLPLHLRPGAREWFAQWLAREHPNLVPAYRRIYGSRSYASKQYRTWLAARVGPLLRKHGLDRPRGRMSGASDDDTWPSGSMPKTAPRDAVIDHEQLALL